MPKVYVTAEDPRFDYSSALKYGEEIIGIFPPGQVLLHPQVALYQARKKLTLMQPDDFLLLSGDPVKIGICSAVAVEKVGKVRFLRWNRRGSLYESVPVDFLERATVDPV